MHYFNCLSMFISSLLSLLLINYKSLWQGRKISILASSLWLFCLRLDLQTFQTLHVHFHLKKLLASWLGLNEVFSEISGELKHEVFFFFFPQRTCNRTLFIRTPLLILNDLGFLIKFLHIFKIFIPRLSIWSMLL